MNITRRDTIIIATLFNLFVIICLIASGKGVSQHTVVTVTRQAGNEHGGGQSPQAIASAEDAKPAPSIAMKPVESYSSFDAMETKDIDSRDDIYSYDEIDQLLEEYVSLEDNASFNKRDYSSPSAQKSSVSNPVRNKVSNSKSSASVSSSKRGSMSQGKAGAKPSQAPKSGVYIVQPGDNPWTIAKKCKISFERLLELNNLDETKAKNLKIGQALKIEEPSDQRGRRSP